MLYLLNKYGSDKNHILLTTIYLKEISLFQDMNEVWHVWEKMDLNLQELV